jgi:hypothetical protein
MRYCSASRTRYAGRRRILSNGPVTERPAPRLGARKTQMPDKDVAAAPPKTKRRRRANNEGSVGSTVQKDRRRRGYVTLPDGGRQWVSGTTKADVAAKVAELRQQQEER